jgi:hypothetical protein
MTDYDNREDEIDEGGRNPTQQRLDEEGVEDEPVDANWEPAAPRVGEVEGREDDYDMTEHDRGPGEAT